MSKHADIQTKTPKIEGLDGSSKIISKLKAALNADGDFPVRARVVYELRKLVGDINTPIEKIVDLILGEPALGTRILHLVNSVYYQRSVPVMTISQAIMQLGMRALTDLCTGLVLLRRFSPIAKKGGIFADNVKKCILSSLLTSMLASEIGDENEERGYLAGTFYSIGPLLLAYYFPQVFESAQERAVRRGQSTTQSITESLGISPIELSLGVVDSLAIPQFYRDLLEDAYRIHLREAAGTEYEENEGLEHEDEPLALAHVLSTAGTLADAIIDTQTRPEISSSIKKISERSGFTHEQLLSVLSQVPVSFSQHCKMIDMSFLELPEHFVTYIETKDSPESAPHEVLSSTEEEFSYYTNEIKEAIANEETLSSIITSAMEALAFGLKFDRVMLLFANTSGSRLQAKMVLGESFEIDLDTFSRKINKRSQDLSPDASAYLEGIVEVFGEPLFANGWPFAALPIGSGEQKMGVIYADRLLHTDDESQPLSDGDQVAINILADLLDKALTTSA